MTCDFSCPSCGKKLFSYEDRAVKYGCMIKNCKKCGKKYIDPRYHELAISGIPDDAFNIPPYIVMIVFGVLLAWRGKYLFGVHQLNTPDEIQWLLPTVFIILGMASIIGSVIGIVRIKTGAKQNKFEKMYEESIKRMNDREYVSSLLQLGFDVPEKFRINEFYYNDQE